MDANRLLAFVSGKKGRQPSGRFSGLRNSSMAIILTKRIITHQSLFQKSLTTKITAAYPRSPRRFLSRKIIKIIAVETF